VPRLAQGFLEAKTRGIDVDKAVLTDRKSSELGRSAVTDLLDEMGAFKTSTLRNVAATPPYMHDGSLKTLRDVVEHYNNGGVTPKDAPVNDYLSGGIRPLNLTDAQIDDLVAFLETLTSPEYAAQAKALNASGLKTTQTR
jgi:cytochrome c peroxidase